MALIIPQGYNPSFIYANWQAAVPDQTTLGTAVTPGTSGSEGSWTEIAAAASITQDCAGFELQVTYGGVSGQLKSFLLDIGVDPAGGTAYTAVISNLTTGCGNFAGGAMGYRFLFPLFVKSGSSIAARIQGSHAVATAQRVAIELFGRAKWPNSLPVGMFSESIGTPSGSLGQSVTPGNATWGSYADLGATTNPMWWWQMSVSGGLSTKSTEQLFCELAYGDASNKHTIIKDFLYTTTTEEASMVFDSNVNLFEAYCPVPAGANIYCRMMCVNAPDAGYNAMAVGIGG